MAGNSFGKLFRITTFGESHGKAIGVVIDGCPAGLELNEQDIQKELDRRKPGQSELTTPRKEKDRVEILSGVFEGKTLGTPIMLLAYNKNVKSEDYEHIKELYRPGHADKVYQDKYGHRDWRGGGRSSARETWARVAAGAIAKKFLKSQGVEFLAYVEQIGGIEADVEFADVKSDDVEANPVRCPDKNAAKEMQKLIEKVKEEGDSLGGVVRGVIRGLPGGLGDPVYDKLEAELAKAMLSINASKGFDIGRGFYAANLKGSEHNDEYVLEDGKVIMKTNNSGGILGGISTGADVFFRVVFKPTATISKTQKTVSAKGEEVELEAQGRHDPCVLPRAVPIVEAMAALVIMDEFLLNRAYTS